jgi:hypothetical protein
MSSAAGAMGLRDTSQIMAMQIESERDINAIALT